MSKFTDSHSHSQMSIMFIIMMISALLSTMNIYVDKISDMRLTMNDFYMALLMSGWMTLFMGIYYKSILYIFIGGFIVTLSLYLIRNQVLITNKEYLRSMIPHHSMALHLTRQQLEENIELPILFRILTAGIIETQEKEIQIMKYLESKVNK
jgi:hypothetical protein